MTTYLKCKKCGYNFAASTIAYMAGMVDCPNCGFPRADTQIITANHKEVQTK